MSLDRSVSTLNAMHAFITALMSTASHVFGEAEVAADGEVVDCGSMRLDEAAGLENAASVR